VHITTATDEVLIQFGGRSGWATRLVCLSHLLNFPRKMLIVSGRENFLRSTSTAQTDQNGIPNIYHRSSGANSSIRILHCSQISFGWFQPSNLHYGGP
jgi:hypothetical protein